MSSPGILRLSHATVRVPDIELALAYYAEVVGLVVTGRDRVGGDDERAYLKGWDEHQHHSLVLQKAPTYGLDGLAFKVMEPDELDRLAGRVTAAGVDVELRKDMWEVVADLKAQGTTIILTTHYIEEAEAIADRIAVISDGKILLVEETANLMRQMGQKEMTIELQAPIEAIPEAYATIAGELNAPKLDALPRIRAQSLVSYRDAYTDQMIAIVADVYADDIAALDYEF